MAFRGWPEQALEFFEGLEADNSKTYWTEHKASYAEHVLGPMTELTEELAAEFGEPKIFRPYRDVRFSADKSLYKTNIAATVGPMAYIQFSADGLAAASGIYSMEPDRLARYRAAVADDEKGPELERIITAIEKADVSVRSPASLKSAPRGYPVDHPRIALLRHKGLYAWQDWPVEPWLETAKAGEHVRDFLRTAGDFAGWLTTHVTLADLRGTVSLRRSARSKGDIR